MSHHKGVVTRGRRLCPRAWQSFAIAILIGFVASWRLQLESGTIGLLHDWSILPSAQQNTALAGQIYNGWYKWSLGSPVTFPTEYPVRFILGAFGLMGIGGNLETHAVVFLIPAAAFLFMWLCAYSLAGSNIGAMAAGIFYALNPVMLNKMVSGQTAYQVGYCMLPLVLWAYKRAVARSHYALPSLGFGATVALAGVQIQLGLLAVFIGVVAAISNVFTVPLQRRVAVLIIGLTTALVIEMPTLVGIMGGTNGFADRAQFSHSVAYLGMNSVPLGDSLRLIGYLTHYDTIAISRWLWPWNISMAVIVFVAVVGIIGAPSGVRIFSAIVFFMALFLLMGTDSIFGPAISWLFEKVRYMEVFRELYHFMALPALIYAVGIAYFMQFAKKWRHARVICVIVWSSIIMVSVPMLTGDADGWMRAFPIERAYGDALKAQNNGEGRVLWLPMDQPVSFREHGAGVDPMSTTVRGSLWDYALNWPLTALDSEIREGNGNIERDLEALNVGDVVEREDMQSQLARFTVDPIDADRFFSSPMLINLHNPIRYRLAKGYRVPNTIALESRRNEVALMPQRLSVCAPAVVAGYAPFAFFQKRPKDLAYAFFYDPQDIAEESIELQGLADPLPTTSIDARSGFAPSATWWWRRTEYADIPSVAVAFGRQKLAIKTVRSYRAAEAVIAWIATPVGGRLRVAVQGRSFTISTFGAGQWASAAFTLGNLPRNTTLSISTLDKGGEVAVRDVTILDRATYRRARGLWQRTRYRAKDAAPLVASTRTHLARLGTSLSVGYLVRGARYRLSVRQQREPILLTDSTGYVIARIPGWNKGWRPNLVTEFSGTGTVAHFTAQKPIGLWKIDRITAAPLDIPKPSVNESRHLLLWNWAYDKTWRLSVPARHFESAIDTNIFEFKRTENMPRVYYAKSAMFHLSYVLGCTVIAISLLANALCREKCDKKQSSALENDG